MRSSSRADGPRSIRLTPAVLDITRQILDDAFAARYGVAAFNIVNDLTLDAVMAAAEALSAPVIIQTSVKTVKAMGPAVLAAIFRARAATSPIPAALRLDHCPDRSMITVCLRHGWNSVLFDASALTLEDNTRQTIEVVAEARRAGAHVEGEIESVRGVEDGIGSDAARDVYALEASVAFIRATGVDCFAPAVGTGPRPVHDRASPRHDAALDHRGAGADSYGPARGHGPDGGAVRRHDRPGLRQGEHLDRAEDQLPGRYSGLPRSRAPQERPSRRSSRSSTRPSWRPPAPTSCCSEAPGEPDAGLIFDCDGVLADTERFGHLPAFNQTFREFGLSVVWSEEESGRLLQIAGGKERLASLLTPEFVAEAGLPTGADAQRELVACWHTRKTAIYTAMVADGKLPPRPGIGRVIEAALGAGWSLAVASTRPRPRCAPSSKPARVPLRRPIPAVLAGDIVARKKPAPDIYALALARLGRAAGVGARHRGFPHRPAGRVGVRTGHGGHRQRVPAGRVP